VIKLKDDMKNVTGLKNFSTGVATNQVISFLEWDKIESHQAIDKDPQFPVLLKNCLALASKQELYHVQLG
jgi:hypothetical protein